MDSRTLLAMFEAIRERKLALDSLTIIRNGYIVADVYFHPFDSRSKHIIESVTKSVTSALVGIALDKGHLKGLDQPILDFFPEQASDGLGEAKQHITLEHLLTMTSGLDTRDSYRYRYAGFYEMLASGNWVRHVLARPLATEPGEAFEYSNGASHLLSAILQKATGKTALTFAEEHLFGPLGIADVSWASDPQGITIGEGQMMLQPRDLAKIGLLYLNRGRWEGTQVISESWVAASTRKQVTSTPVSGYGYLWWIDGKGTYLAMGHLGQFLFVVPEQSLVVVATGNLKGGQFFAPQQLLHQFIIPAVLSDEPLEPRPAVNAEIDALVAGFAEEPAEGVTWTEKGEGVAKAGVYRHRSPVAFSFEYPKTSRKSRMRVNQVMAMTTQLEGEFGASIGEIPDGVALSDVGPEIYAKDLRDLGSPVEVRSNEPIVLADGTAAYRTELDWRTKASFAKRILQVSAYVDDRWVSLTYAFPVDYHEATLGENLSEGASIVESLRFE